MTEKTKHQSSMKIPLFVKSKQIIDQKNKYSTEENVEIIDELSEYDNSIINQRQQNIEAAFNDIISILIKPVNELFKEEYIDK
jgi:hypothetical protein